MRWMECKVDADTKRVLMVKDPIAIGRSASCEFSFPHDKEVSRLHAVIELRGLHWYLVDQKSTNGSFVNGQRATVPFPLKDDDLIEIGDQRLFVKSGLTFGLQSESSFKFQGYPHYYVLLKVEIGASQLDIDAAYSALLEIYDTTLHPNSDMVKRLAEELEEAYGVLGNPDRRAQYDATLSDRTEA